MRPVLRGDAAGLAGLKAEAARSFCVFRRYCDVSQQRAYRPKHHHLQISILQSHASQTRDEYPSAKRTFATAPEQPQPRAPSTNQTPRFLHVKVESEDGEQGTGTFLDSTLISTKRSRATRLGLCQGLFVFDFAVCPETSCLSPTHRFLWFEGRSRSDGGEGETNTRGRCGLWYGGASDGVFAAGGSEREI